MLHAIYRNARQEKRAFLDHIVPLALSDACLGTPEDQVEHAKYWEARFMRLKADLQYLSVESFRLYRDMQDWYNHVGEMLGYINEVRSHRGFEDIVKDDFKALREMLQLVAKGHDPEVVKNIVGEWLELKQRSNFQRPCSLITFERGKEGHNRPFRESRVRVRHPQLDLVRRDRRHSLTASKFLCRMG